MYFKPKRTSLDLITQRKREAAQAWAAFERATERAQAADDKGDTVLADRLWLQAADLQKYALAKEDIAIKLVERRASGH